MSRILKAFTLVVLFALHLLPAQADDFLDPEQAFKLTVRPVDDKTVEAAWEIAPGYYMYREQFKVSADGATLGAPEVPNGETKFDETFQKQVEIYHDALKVRIPVSQANGAFKLTLVGQGCAVKGLCYPPMTTLWLVDLANATAKKVDVADPVVNPAVTPSANVADAKPAAADDEVTAALKAGKFWPLVWGCLGIGLVLAFTPCVLPMVPILSSIIVGSGGAISRTRGFMLAFSYSLGVAVVYTSLGVAAGLAGRGLAAELQNPWVLGTFGIFLAVFALSMLGAYELQLPAGLSGRLTETSQKIPGGKFVGVFIMGAVSALLVSPCVTGPLASTLLYIGKTGDVVLGGSALFALAWGMSVPLLITGASAGELLPRAGKWMEMVKHAFGLVMLAVAIYTVQPVLPVAVAQLLWGALLIGTAAMFGLFESAPATSPLAWLRKALAVVALVGGGAQLIGAAQGGTDVLRPLASLHGGSGVAGTAQAETGAVHFQKIASVAELDAALASAGRPVMLDFYADWCVSCKEMERDTFTDPAVRTRLSKALLLQADVTANTAADKELLKRFNLFGPPGTIFFNAHGAEVGQRVVGFQDAPTFGASLATAGL